MAVNIRKVFKANCGPEARYLGHIFRPRGEYRTVVIAFKRGKRTFELDGVIHLGATENERIENAVIRIAGIAKGLKQVLDGRDGSGQLEITRQLS